MPSALWLRFPVPPCLLPCSVRRSHNEAIKGYLRRTVLPNLRMKRGPFLLQVRVCTCDRRAVAGAPHWPCGG
jgi:hypothetical protein